MNLGKISNLSKFVKDVFANNIEKNVNNMDKQIVEN